MRLRRLFTTVDPKETLRFAEYKWWSSSNVLHPFSDLRVQFIKEQTSSNTLNGFEILDVGCGGGLLTERMARLGGRVVAIDPTTEAIEVAKSHLPKYLTDRVAYQNCDLTSVSQSFDIVVASEVIEHVSDSKLFITQLSEKIKPGGHLFLTSVSKTWEAWFLGIFVSEQILRIVEPGTHQWEKFINPSDLIKDCEASQLQFIHKKGWFVDLLKYQTFFTDYDRLGYLLHFIKK